MFKLLRLPVPSLLGTIAVIGTLRGLGVELPLPPPFLSLLLQVMIGIIVGSRITQEVAASLKDMLKPALVIVTWALSIVFLLGIFLANVTYLDIFTAVLSSSMGGLPEITMIALATNADVAVIIIIQTVRMLATIVVFPFILKSWMAREGEKIEGGVEGVASVEAPNVLARNNYGKKRDRTALFPGYYFVVEVVRKAESWAAEKWVEIKQRSVSYLRQRKAFFPFIKSFIFTLILALAGGISLHYIGIPAGAMVGATLLVAFFSLKGFPVITLPPLVFELMLIGVGIIVSANITPNTVEVLISGKILPPLLLSTLIIFLSSFLVSYIISKVADWDYPTSFLAAAPGGFTVMTALAVTYEKNPFRVSMLHLSRLISLKTVIPLFFWFII